MPQLPLPLSRRLVYSNVVATAAAAARRDGGAARAISCCCLQTPSMVTKYHRGTTATTPSASLPTSIRTARPCLPSTTPTPYSRPRIQKSISLFHTSSKMSSLYTDETPDSVKSAKGLHLITMSTPNGQKVQIYLEELKDVYGTEWTTTLINIMTNEQKKDWFLALDPNGRIPVLVDNTKSPPFPVMETSAELLYLLKEVDKNNEFGFTDDLERSEALQWLFFWHGSGAPYMGQLNHFGKFAKDKLPYAIERFKNESLRVFGVLEIQLSGKYTGQPREYLAGKGKGKYSVADIGTWPWIKGWDFSGQLTQKDMEPFPHLLKWIDRIAARPAVKRGIGEAYQQS